MPVSVTKPISGDGEPSNAIKSKNPFDVFSEQENLVQQVEQENRSTQVVQVNANDDSDNEVEENIIMETNKSKGPSTPSNVVSNVYKGRRIIMGWNTDVVNLMVVTQTSRAMHMKITHKATNDILFCSFIYAGNLPSERRVLWSDLILHKSVVCGFLWILMGDLNVVLNLEDYLSGPSWIVILRILIFMRRKQHT
ncbi:RNA-directed DNA polymerase, eukaryota, reverse transcriptase zinc-binding domain protein [Tanacetum coccineum]